MVKSTMTHLSKPVVLLALVSACAHVGYIKPGMTEEEVARELSECAEIARHGTPRSHSDPPHETNLCPRNRVRYTRGYQFAPIDDPVME